MFILNSLCDVQRFCVCDFLSFLLVQQNVHYIAGVSNRNHSMEMNGLVYAGARQKTCVLTTVSEYNPTLEETSAA